MGSSGKIGSNVASSAQSRRETGDYNSMVTDVCVSILTREGGEVWVEDDIVVVVQGASDWTSTEDIGGDLS